MIALLGGGVTAGLCHVRKFGRLGYYAGMLVIVFLFSTTAFYCMRTSIRGENDYTMQYAPLFDYLNNNTKKGEVVYTTSENKPAFDLQSRLVDKPVMFTLAERLDEIEGGAYVVVYESQAEALPVKDYEICMECEEFLLLRLNG